MIPLLYLADILKKDSMKTIFLSSLIYGRIFLFSIKSILLKTKTIGLFTSDT